MISLYLGEDISDVLPEREIYKCLICERECMDIKKHIERSILDLSLTLGIHLFSNFDLNFFYIS